MLGVCEHAPITRATRLKSNLLTASYLQVYCGKSSSVCIVLIKLTFRVNLYFFTAATCTILMNKQQCDCNRNAPTDQKGELTYTTAVPIGTSELLTATHT